MYWTAWDRCAARGRPEVERPEVDRLVRRPVHEVEGDAEEALLGDVLPTQVHFDHAVADKHALQQRAAVTRPRIEPGHGAVALFLDRQAAVEDLRALGVGQPPEVGCDGFQRLGERGCGQADGQCGCGEDGAGRSWHGIVLLPVLRREAGRKGSAADEPAVTTRDTVPGSAGPCGSSCGHGTARESGCPAAPRRIGPRWR